MSFEAQSYFLAHFHYEADILNFITKNSGLGMTEVDLKPHSVDDLGEWQARNTVIEHDRNVYSFIQEMGIALNDLGQSSIDITRPSFENLDFSMLNAPDVSVDDEKDQFFLRLDIDSSCAVICFLIATFMTQKDLERAISSLQFDQSLMFLLQQITGDIRFLSWTNLQFTNWVAHYVDSTTALRKHLFCIEYAHGALMQLKKKQSEQVIRASQ